jgi:hypothetical protein
MLAHIVQHFETARNCEVPVQVHMQHLVQECTRHPTWHGSGTSSRSQASLNVIAAHSMPRNTPNTTPALRQSACTKLSTMRRAPASDSRPLWVCGLARARGSPSFNGILRPVLEMEF